MKLASRDAETSFRNTRQSSYYILNELRRVPLLLYITPSGIKKKIPSFQGTAKNRDDEIRREMSRAPCLYGCDLGDPSEDRTNDREGSNRARHAHHANWPGEPASAKNRAAVRAATLDSCASGPEPDGIPLSFSKPLLRSLVRTLCSARVKCVQVGRCSRSRDRSREMPLFRIGHCCISDVCRFVTGQRCRLFL